MAKIDKVRLNPVPVSTGISPGTAAEAQVASAQESQAIQANAQAFFNEAKRASDNAARAKALAIATESADKRIKDRLAAREDEDGNPTFGNIPTDVKNILKEEEQNAGNALPSREARDAFIQSFSSYASSAQMLALGEARGQQVDFSRNTLMSAVKAMEAQAIQADPSQSGTYLDMINQTVSEALASGAITAEERQQLMTETEGSINMAQARAALEQDPAGVAAALNEGNDLGLGSKQAAQLREEANARVKDQENAANHIVANNQKKHELSQEMESQKLAAGLAQGITGEADIIQAENSGSITGAQAEELKVTHKEAQRKMTATEKKNAEISASIKSGENLLGYTAKQIDTHYKEAIKLAEENKGEPLRLEEEAMIASGYKTKVKAFTQKAQYELLYGDRGTEAVRALDFMESKNPIGVEGLSREAEAIASYAQVLEETGVPGDLALRQARTSVLEADDPVRQTRAAEYKVILKENSGKSAQDTIRDLLVDDGIFDFTGEFDNVETIEPGILAKMERIRKDLYLSSGNIEAADKGLAKMAGRSMGVSAFNGGDFLMMHPPEKVWPGIKPAALVQDLDNDLSGMGLTSSDVKLRFNSVTASRQNGPTYFVTKTDEFGNEVPLFDADGDVLEWSPNTEELFKKDQEEKARIAEEVKLRKKQLKEGASDINIRGIR